MQKILLAVKLLLAGWGRGIKYQIFAKTAKTSPLTVNRLNRSPAQGVDDEEREPMLET